MMYDLLNVNGGIKFNTSKQVIPNVYSTFELYSIFKLYNIDYLSKSVMTRNYIDYISNGSLTPISYEDTLMTLQSVLYGILLKQQ